VVALSGGVDSSVVAASVRESIRVCVHMTNWNPHEGAPTTTTTTTTTTTATTSPACSGASDHADAQAVARVLNVPLHHVQFQAEYYHAVFEPFVDEIRRGRMPNPDVRCNSQIKFGALKDYVRDRFGTDSWLATGHYARLWHRHVDDPLSPPDCLVATLSEHAVLRHWLDMRSSRLEDEDNATWLLQAADASKDQSYFLAGCQSRHFQQVLFPLGDSFKKDASAVEGMTPRNGAGSRTVRQLALDFGLPTARKRDSTGICAVGRTRNGFQAFARDYLPPSSSPVIFVDVDTERVVGSVENDHASLYTVGQGARISGASTRYFVTSVSAEDNVVHVCAGTHHPALYADSIEFRMQWVCEAMEELMDLQADQSTNPSLPSLRVTCRIRHLQPLMDARLVRSANGHYLLHLDRPTRAVAPGQMAVVYLGLVCLGGGPIERRGSTYFERNEPLPDRLYRGGHNDTSLVPLASTTCTVLAGATSC
jgi:tRNA U34 2-thiouridine synthase MnmA/TrmU